MIDCRNPRRRADARARMNGIDFIEVSPSQRVLTVTLFQDAPSDIGIANVRVEGGVRITDLRVEDVRLGAAGNPDDTRSILVQLDRPGDASVYTLSIVGLPDFDPHFSHSDFRFRLDCPTGLDCAAPCPPSAAPGPDPELNYLARDYQGFRQLLLDRLSIAAPDWTERHIPDLGITLVEILAYVGDRLSYYQDAVATEAYLGTARQRISVRRHARLMDYALHEGNNARAFVAVHVQGADPPAIDAADLDLITACRLVSPDAPRLVSAEALAEVPLAEYEVFRPVFAGAISLRQVHNEISFYTWGDRECALLKGATSATLLDAPETAQPDAPRKLRNLTPGDLLLLEELRDPFRCHPVLLTHVTPAVDPLYNQPIVEIRWAAADALPFRLVLSAVKPPDCILAPTAVARGNVVLVDHGRLVEAESLGAVPSIEVVQPCAAEGEPQDRVFRAGPFHPALSRGPLTFREDPPTTPLSAAALLVQDARRARPQILQLAEGPNQWQLRPDLLNSSGTDSVYCVEVDDAGLGRLRFGDGTLGRAPAFGGANVVARTVKGYPDPDHSPVSAAGHLLLTVGEEEYPLTLADNTLNGLRAAIEAAGAGVTARVWRVRGHDHPYFLYVSVDRIGRILLRLIDNPDSGGPDLLPWPLTRPGADPPPFVATYRAGNGPAGNVGASAICGLVLRNTKLDGVELAPRNPLAATGGTSPEPLPDAKRRIPVAFRQDLQRAITADDYARLAERHPRVQRAAATLRWTGSRTFVHVAIDPLGAATPDRDLLREVAVLLYPYRRIGHDIDVVAAKYIPIYLELLVEVDPDYSTGHVKAALLDAFRAFFQPDNLTFGDSVYLSRIVTAALAVAGVVTVQVCGLHRLFEAPAGEKECGLLRISPLEVARLDNDPEHPENGMLVLNMEGGR